MQCSAIPGVLVRGLETGHARYLDSLPPCRHLCRQPSHLHTAMRDVLTRCCRIPWPQPPPPPEEDDGPSLADAFDPNNVPGSMGSMAFFVAARGGKVGRGHLRLGARAARTLRLRSQPRAAIHGSISSGGGDWAFRLSVR